MIIRRRGVGVPDWARLQREADLDWIGEILPILWPLAQAQFKAYGRGAVVIDTTSVPLEGAGHPIMYCPASLINETGSEDERRMVAQYDPNKELLVILIKQGYTVSTYRLQEVNPPVVEQGGNEA